MKHICILSAIFILIISCKKTEDNQKTLNPLEEIAYANGFGNWNNVEEIQFTFNVDRDTTHFERSWKWRPKTNEITLIKKGETLTFERGQILSDAELIADKNFINDIYWLLAPFKLVWDKGIDYEAPIMEIAPISKDSLRKTTITYTNQGGYTPGDAYDFYVDKDNEIKEWVYREDNSASKYIATTWEDYKSFNGIKIATMHQNENGDFKLYFTNIKVKVSEK